MLGEEDLRSLEDLIDWVARSKDEAEWIERAQGLHAFVQSHPRLSKAARSFRDRRADA